LLAAVDLPPDTRTARPAGLSGGQRQRLQLARAVAAEPRVLVADEPASSLDSRTQGRVLDLLRRLQRDHDLAVVLVAHDLALVERWADAVMVMLAGHVVEVYWPGAGQRPWHPFARDLLAAAPGAGEAVQGRGGDVRAGSSRGSETAATGCPYAPRCTLVRPACRRSLPTLESGAAGRLLRCPEADRQAR
jgi:ABC-type dipeptide/oligopeptide/nickel transport system ATPase component